MNRPISIFAARRNAFAAALLGAFAAPWAEAADPGQPLGPAIEVSTSTSAQGSPVIARNATGAMVVAWQDHGSGAILARRFDAAGTAQGAAFVANENTGSPKNSPAVAINDDGDFVVAWHSGFDNQAYARRFAADGSPESGDLGMVERHLRGQVIEPPAVAMDDDGDFVVAWAQRKHLGPSDWLCSYSPLGCINAEGASVRARRYSAGGTRAGDTLTVDVAADDIDLLRLSLPGGSDEGQPSVAMGHDGSFMVAWDRPGDGALSGVYVRRYSALGLPGLPQRIADTNGDTLARPRAATDGNGRYVVAYQQPDGIYARVYGRLGLPDGAPQRAEDGPAPGDQYPAVSMDAAGDFVVAWPFQAQRFAHGGGKLGVNFPIDGGTGTPAVASDAAGNFAFVWSDEQARIRLRLFAGP